MEKKQKVRAIFQVGAWLAFLMLGYLGIRSYRLSVEKLKTNSCIDEIETLYMNIKGKYSVARDYDGLNYKLAVSLGVIPKSMMRKGFNEATNAYMGGVDFFYSSLSSTNKTGAFEISFQGLSRYGCMQLVKMNWNVDDASNIIAVAGYSVPTPAYVLDEVYPETQPKDIKSHNILKGNLAPYVGDDQLEKICGCKEDLCSVVWKFR